MEKQINLEEMNEEQLKILEDILGSKVRDISDEACLKMNEILKVYGLRTLIQIKIEEIKE